MATGNEPTIQVSLSAVLRPVQWGALGVAVLLLLLGFSGKEYGYLIASCFLGIVSRIAQAEHHHSQLLGAKQE